jgi:GNAT superfamily N-acetyltransferase
VDETQPPGEGPLLRPATSDELPALRELERAAGEPFRAIGMAEIADEEPLPLADLRHFQAADRAWVVAERGRLLGFLLAEPVDDRLHVAQVSVHPGAAGRRLGSALIDHAGRRAGAANGLSLTTYRDVPWNAPYYRRLGFRELPDDRLGPGMATIRAAEQSAGLDRWPRLAMVR